MLQTKAKPRLPVRGSFTPDNPQGIMLTAAQALKHAQRGMPPELARAGFHATVTRGREIHNYTYRDCWNLNYSK